VNPATHWTGLGQTFGQKHSGDANGLAADKNFAESVAGCEATIRIMKGDKTDIWKLL
jgi:hypothetical protein